MIGRHAVRHAQAHPRHRTSIQRPLNRSGQHAGLLRPSTSCQHQAVEKLEPVIAPVKQREIESPMERHRREQLQPSGCRLQAAGRVNRFAQLVPPPRTHRHRYYGVLAPNSPLRAAVTAMAQDALVAAPVVRSSAQFYG